MADNWNSRFYFHEMTWLSDSERSELMTNNRRGRARFSAGEIQRQQNLLMWVRARYGKLPGREGLDAVLQLDP